MVVDPIIDTVFAVTILLTVIKTIHICLSSSTPEDSMDKNFPMKAKIKSVKSIQSFNDLSTLVDIEEPSKIVSPIQKNASNQCFECSKQLFNNYQKDYFAFDRQYCRFCWNKIHFKVVNKNP